MKIQLTDILTGEAVGLTASFTTDHPTSHYGQPVMYVNEWEDCISHQNWVLGGASIIEATPEEISVFDKWHELIENISANLL